MFEKMNLFSKTSTKILMFLSRHPYAEFYEREISRKAGVSAGAANQTLRLFWRSGIVQREKRGRMYFCKLNIESPLVRQFKVLFNIIELSGLIDEIRGLSKKVVLFGSAAEGRDTAESDIDLLILTDEKERVRKKLTKIEKTLDRKISSIIANYNELLKLKKENKALTKNIDKGIILWEK